MKSDMLPLVTFLNLDHNKNRLVMVEMASNSLRILIIALCFLGIRSQGPEVEIRQGRLRGDTRRNIDGGLYYSFQNIPFGKPPVGELRFKAPLPADGWEGIRDATVDLPECTQMSAGAFGAGQEDCLYLNIYTPGLPSQNITGKTVMVFLYGGSFNSGSAVESLYGAQFLLLEDVILVVANYRVGFFGFISLDDPDLGIPGNAGMKDQLLALQWVKANIASFGGDPENVAIFGQSAGGASVHLHVLSPLSQGLFNRAIAQSGTIFLMPYEGERNSALLLANVLGIDTSNWRSMVEVLQVAPVDWIFFGELYLTSIFPFITRPIVEIPSTNESAFLLENPFHTIQSGNYNHVPLLWGLNNAEGLLWQLLSRWTTGESMLITDFTEFIPQDLRIIPGSEEEAIITRRLREFYFGDQEPSRDNITGAVNLYTDWAYAFPAHRYSLEHLKNAQYPIYFYYFTVDAGLNFFKLLEETTAAYPGAAHSDELGYMLHNEFLPAYIPVGSVEDLALRTVVQLWTGFAKYGNPTEKFDSFEWLPVKPDEFNYLRIDTEKIEMQINPRQKNVEFWYSLYEEFHPQSRVN